MPADLRALAADLTAEQEALDARVAPPEHAAWVRPTPAEGWSIADSISHLAFYDRTARLALTEPDAFAEHRAAMAAMAAAGPAAEPDLDLGRSEAPDVLLADWRSGRAAVLDALADIDPAARIPWYGPPMSPASFVTARLMETWAHGTDVSDALGLAPVVSARLRHVVDLGVRARPYAFAVHGVNDAGDPVAVVAEAPDGDTWTWGEPAAAQHLRGPALDLALLFTQRRHPDDLAVAATGPAAVAWLAVAQAFAGPAGPGRAPLGGAR